jgi:hypothetical protein
MGYRLGIDFGTSNTVAVVCQPNGRTRPVLFDGFPLLPSSVCVSIDGGELLVGREAAHSARVHPERFEPHPKRRIDDGTVLLGTDEYPVAQLIAAVLGRVRAEVVRMMGGQPGSVVLTYPAAWGARRRAVLLDAARRAGLEGPELLAEPVAAASYFVNGTEVDVAVGSCVVVYDFGAGTFDASVLRRTADDWEILASEGLPDAGGLDVDAAIVAYIAATYTSSRPDEVRRLEAPESAGDRRANRLLWDDVRTAKEVLSRVSSTYVHLPLIEDDVPLGREQLERLARPVLDRTVSLTRTLISGVVRDGTLAAVFLVGGSSRMPLAATLLHRAVRVSPTAIEQPEVVVAEGSARGYNHTTVWPSARPPADDASAHADPVAPAADLSDSWPPVSAELPADLFAATGPLATAPDTAGVPAVSAVPAPPEVGPPAAAASAASPAADSGSPASAASPVSAAEPVSSAREVAAVGGRAAEPAPRPNWITALFAIVAFAALMVLIWLPHTQDNAALDYWERLLSWPSAALLPAYLGWLVYRFASSSAWQAVASVPVHMIVLSALIIGAVQLADTGSDNTRQVKFTAVVALSAIAVIALLWPRRSSSPPGRRIFGVADVAASVVAAIVYGFANYAMDGPGGRLPPDSSTAAALLTISVFTATLAVLVLGAAVGVLLGRTRPALIPTLRISSGVLLLVGSAITALAVALHVFT